MRDETARDSDERVLVVDDEPGVVADVPVLHKPFTSYQIETTVRDVLDAELPSSSSPIPSVRRPLDPLQVNAVLACIASGAARNNQPIAGFERLLGNAIT